MKSSLVFFFDTNIQFLFEFMEWNVMFQSMKFSPILVDLKSARRYF